MSGGLEAAIVPVLAALATGLPVMFGALRQVPRLLEALERASSSLERIAVRLERAEYVHLSSPPTETNGAYHRRERS